jgi:hypothetical protein
MSPPTPSKSARGGAWASRSPESLPPAADEAHACERDSFYSPECVEEEISEVGVAPVPSPRACRRPCACRVRCSSYPTLVEIAS